MLKIAAGYLIAVNLLTYLVYGWDKRRARKGRRRISEKELLMWALAGGSFGAFLSMRRHRHKTGKLSFRLSFWAIVVLQIAGAWLLTTRPWE